MDEGRLPTGVWVDAECAKLAAAGQSYYIVRRGNVASGVVMVKVHDYVQRVCALYLQQRNFEGQLGWVHAVGAQPLAESEVDGYIQRSIRQDPDMWVIEIEARGRDNPFEGPIFE